MYGRQPPLSAAARWPSSVHTAVSTSVASYVQHLADEFQQQQGHDTVCCIYRTNDVFFESKTSSCNVVAQQCDSFCVHSGATQLNFACRIVDPSVCDQSEQVINYILQFCVSYCYDQ
jgi:hypothetical protein